MLGPHLGAAEEDRPDGVTFPEQRDRQDRARAVGRALGRLPRYREFVGREALKAWKSKPGPIRVGLVLEGRRIARQGAAVLSDDQEVGQAKNEAGQGGGGQDDEKELAPLGFLLGHGCQ